MWPTLLRALASQAWRLSGLLGSIVAASDLIGEAQEPLAPVAVKASLSTTLGVGIGFGAAVWMLTRNER